MRPAGQCQTAQVPFNQTQEKQKAVIAKLLCRIRMIGTLCPGRCKKCAQLDLAAKLYLNS